MEAGAIKLKETILRLSEMEVSRMSIELYCKVVVDNIVDKSSGLPNIVIS
jgi:hypothetical protein